MADREIWRVFPGRTAGWDVARDGDGRPPSSYRTKREAVEAASKLARAAPHGLLVVLRRDGTLQRTHSYGGPPPHMSELSGIGDSGGSDVARLKDEYLAEAIAADLR